MPFSSSPVEGAGLGLRRSLIQEIENAPKGAIDFLEIAPENWLGVGGRYGRKFRELLERYPFVCHGLSLSIGGVAPLDTAFLARVRDFVDANGIRCYSEHLSYTDDGGHLYDLMPIPFTREAVEYVSGRICQAQDVLGRRLALENVSYYAAPGQEMSELEFLNAVLERADCDLLLDVNNIYVNSINHRYDPVEFLQGIPTGRIAYCHVAGHHEEAPDLRIDTHGAAVIDPVWSLLDEAYRIHGVFPTLLERDNNFPPFEELLGELNVIKHLQARHGAGNERIHATA